MGWSDTLTVAFEALQTTIASRVALAHRDEKKVLCFYTDSSDTYWTGIVTQVPVEDLSKPHADQRHEPFSFHSLRFTAAELGWVTAEKESYASVASIKRSRWLSRCPAGFDLYTNHNISIFIFDPTTILPGIGLGAPQKVLRWALWMSAYN